MEIQGSALRVRLNELNLIHSSTHDMARTVVTRESRHKKAATLSRSSLPRGAQEHIHFGVHCTAEFQQASDSGFLQSFAKGVLLRIGKLCLFFDALKHRPGFTDFFWNLIALERLMLDLRKHSHSPFENFPLLVL